jgi:hypothetical protein
LPPSFAVLLSRFFELNSEYEEIAALINARVAEII